MTIPSILTGHFAGGRNLSVPGSAGDSTLEELLTATKSTVEDGGTTVPTRPTLLYVNNGYDGDEENGSLLHPYKTVQGAIDAFEDLATTPDYYFPACVLIYPGTYDENLLIRKQAIRIELRGLCDFPTVQINPTTGVPLTVTNASDASLATYQASGVYSDLAPRATPESGPESVSVSNLSIAPVENNNQGIELLGVAGDDTPTTTRFLFGFQMYDSYIYGSGTGYSVHARNCNGVLGWNTIFIQKLRIHNVSNTDIWWARTYFGHDSHYDATDPEGQPTSGHIQSIYSNSDLGGDLTLSGTVDFQVKQGIANNNIAVEDTANLTLNTAHVKGDISAEAAATITANGCHMGGDINLAAGAGAVTFNGGEYMGALTDPGARLTFNLGTIGT